MEGGILVIHPEEMLDTRPGTAAVDVEAVMESVETCFSSSSRVAPAPRHVGAVKGPATGRSLFPDDELFAPPFRSVD